MAEGDIFEETDEQGNPTGNTFIETATGEFVNQVTGSGPAVAAGITSAAMDNILIAKGITDVVGGAADLVGLDDTAAAMRRASDRIQAARDNAQSDFMDAAKAEFPVQFFAGELAGSYLPGAGRGQAAFGALQGVGFADDTAGAALNATVAGAFGALGARAGNRAQQRLSRRMQLGADDYSRARAEAAAYLESLEVPLRESDLASRNSRAAQTRDRLRVLRDGDDMQIRAKRDALNEIVTDRVLPGEGTSALTTRWRNKLQDEISKKYTALRAMLPSKVTQNPNSDAEVARMITILDDVAPDDRGRIEFYMNRIIDDYTGGTLTPERWTQLRSRIAKQARDFGRQGIWEGAQDLYKVREHLDNIVHGGNPDIVAAMNEANELWRVGEVLESRHVINRDLDLNPGAFTRNLEAMFPDVWKSDSNNPEVAKEFYEIMEASEIFPAFRSSGTGEMLTASNLRKQLSVRMQLGLGTLGEQVGGSVGRRTAQALLEGGEAVVNAFKDIPGHIVSAFSDDDDELRDAADTD